MQRKNKIIIALFSFLVIVPVLVFAQDPLIETGDDVIGIINNITNWLWRLFAAVAVLAFLIAGFMYVTAAGDSDKITKANNMVKYGIIGVVVALLSAGMVQLIESLLVGS